MELRETRPPKSVLITDELDRRPPRDADYRAEKEALQDLARRMTENPEAVLEGLVDLALDITGSVSGGISLFEEQDEGPGIFRWHFLRGELAPYNGGITPRDHSPCGVCLDFGEPILLEHPERYFTWLVDAGVSAPECLLVPLSVGATDPLGTLWIVSEDVRYFDRNHARALDELATFAGLALHTLQGKRILQQALERQETLTHEMNHRVKNLFEMVQSMIRSTARSAATTDAFATQLSERIHALATATELARGPARRHDGAARAVDFRQLLETVLRPHKGAAGTAEEPVRLAGPPVELTTKAAEAVALLVHELATNAVKYGALSADTGTIDISWEATGGHLRLAWRERGGPAIDAEPGESGFGTRLVSTTVRFLDGTLDYDWQAEGLTVRISLPSTVFAE